eukprot:699370-Amphidinium_carterae.1
MKGKCVLTFLAALDDIGVVTPGLCEASVSSAAPSSDRDLDAALIAEPKDEVNNGWASGPFYLDELD